MSKNWTPPSGTRDFLPVESRQRQDFVRTVQGIFESFGFEPLETPAFEKWEFLEGKLGDEGEQLLFKILRRNTDLEKLRSQELQKVEFQKFTDAIDFALHYDLTVPFCRVLASNQLPMPFKRYQIQPVWRADRPQKGRYREFYQCDVDIAGAESVTADVELLVIAYESLSQLGLENFLVRLNHRKVITGLLEVSGIPSESFKHVTIAVDKLDKIGEEGVLKELAKANIDTQLATQLIQRMNYQGSISETLEQLNQWLADNSTGKEGVKDLQEMVELLQVYQLDMNRFTLDLFLMRGLDYYTGPIFEIIDTNISIGTISSGGRYDQLVEKISGKSIPCAGMSLGMDRILDVMKEYHLLQENKASADVMVSVFEEAFLQHSVLLAQKLRKEGLRVEVPLKHLGKLQKQIKYANSKNIECIAVLGSEEIENGTVVLRRGKEEQVTLPQEEAASWLLSKRDSL